MQADVMKRTKGLGILQYVLFVKSTVASPYLLTKIDSRLVFPCLKDLRGNCTVLKSIYALVYNLWEK